MRSPERERENSFADKHVKKKKIIKREMRSPSPERKERMMKKMRMMRRRVREH